jgi:hypothetical protein
MPAPWCGSRCRTRDKAAELPVFFWFRNQEQPPQMEDWMKETRKITSKRLFNTAGSRFGKRCLFEPKVTSFQS